METFQGGGIVVSFVLFKKRKRGAVHGNFRMGEKVGKNKLSEEEILRGKESATNLEGNVGEKKVLLIGKKRRPGGKPSRGRLSWGLCFGRGLHKSVKRTATERAQIIGGKGGLSRT